MLRKALLGTYLCSLFIVGNAYGAEGDDIPQRAQTAGDVIERPGVLTPKGKWSFDSSLSYTQNSSNKVSVVGYTVLPTLIIGRIEVSDSDRTTVTVGLTARYGLTNATELEVRVPYVYRNDQVSTRPIQDGSNSEVVNTTVDGGGLGDVEFALRHQFNFESAPYWVGGLRVKSDTGRSPYDVSIEDGSNAFSDVPTGSGFWSFEPNLSLIHPVDPAVLFASLSYIYNLEDTVTVGDTKADVDLGDTISLSGGMGFAVNPDLSFSLGLSHKTILKSKVNGRSADDAKLLQLDALTFGINYAFSERSSINVSAQAGLTEDTPDFQLTVRVPFNL
ncbi:MULTISPECIES: transporter [Vibrio]|nr:MULTISPECIES: transporter [Vibrio]EGQ7844496.1 transporter [Vibrio alginolyticus]EGR0722385.1 transporter [Vibrio alginolyticus]EGR1297745.1 transporter [Vibrio alginolyticus]EGR1563392.1 transporter [Vibrio alginolyticus]EGR1574504.1 transporter [Vibrio alginolyticus]